MPPAPRPRRAGPARRRGAFFFIRQLQLPQGLGDGPGRDGQAQAACQFLERGVGPGLDQFGQLPAVDLAAAGPAAGAGGDVPAFTAVLLEPPDPGGADAEGLGRLGGGLPGVAGVDHALSQVHGVGLHGPYHARQNVVALEAG